MNLKQKPVVMCTVMACACHKYIKTGQENKPYASTRVLMQVNSTKFPEFARSRGDSFSTKQLGVTTTEDFLCLEVTGEQACCCRVGEGVMGGGEGVALGG